MTKIADLYALIEDMRQHFNWDKTDTKAFVVNSIVEEAQELQQAFTQADKAAVLEELADVLSYSLTLAKMYDVDLYDLLKHKMDIVKGRNYD